MILVSEEMTLGRAEQSAPPLAGGWETRNCDGTFLFANGKGQFRRLEGRPGLLPEIDNFHLILSARNFLEAIRGFDFLEIGSRKTR